MTELDAMRRALALARRGWGRVHPNPLVGAVVLDRDAPVGEGYHAEWGGAHAESAALAEAGPRARGATLVVTLMPCAHHGKTPPCAEAVIAAGIARVVAATEDPNPLASGAAARLRAAGVALATGLLGREARRQNAPYLHRFSGSSRPWVALKLATSLDHRIADRSGHSRWISGEAARRFAQNLRAGFDAVAVGGRTALADDPRLTARGEIAPRVPPVRVLFEGREPLPATLAALATAREVPTLVITAPDRLPGTSARLAGTGAQVLGAASLAESLGALRLRGIEAILVEGGGRLAGALLRDDLVDRTFLIQAPIWLGSAGRPATAGWDGPALDQAPRWEVVERRALGPDTLTVLDRR